MLPMIIRFCDCCGTQLTDANKLEGGWRVIAEYRGICVEVMAGRLKDGTHVMNSGDLCKYCIIDAVKSVDDRPQISGRVGV